MRNITETIKHLLIINVIFFVASLSLGDVMYDWFALHYPSNDNFQLWQPLTHMFMHGDLGHIFFNMFGLYMFGTPIEQMWGRKKFIFFYLSTGFGAAALQLGLYYYQVSHVSDLLTSQGLTVTQITNFFNTRDLPFSIVEELGREKLLSGLSAFNGVMVGASGALYGVLVAFAFLFPNARLMLLFPPIPVKAKILVPILILGDLFFGFTSYSIGPIAHFAHVGGAITGFIMLWYWKKSQFDNNRWN
ncbi:rhomboid family intramembrane serine protease [Flavobacteriaceae bacterium]|jgi:membrane associated rhomboid family serine protease|nr:rhomboid family intramembrane serine protease [Flavobacteriaceae bacterium]MBT4313802.1 rhomboid family intramembrane serine protease [Flavobacteriaceae bacterium]MBT5091728.1 rhomboid family intramembrane serine protease [Flavobacteriaceae bacterium]MBT5283258.1 rhomboid family intramembrane serine protease [Flavobacteriaceae bacterium]MBT5446740.1 rhomboid family intramembrane serine protease [Flavobacteriaceae bacterium]|tara:strand:- start:10368 stop:11105 length:738 start_codon:yes stop_codon:yes gene_type:complete